MPGDLPARFCCDRDLALIGYDGRDAEKDLSAWRAGRGRAITRELIEAIRTQGVEGASLLDVGAGVGMIHVTLLEAGAARAVDVDASREYLTAARGEAERRGLADRVEYRYGDLVELAAELPPADIVTLDAVICCYPYLAPLLRAALTPQPRLVGLTYPHDAWWMRGALGLLNVLSAVRRQPDHWYIHRRAEIDRLMTEAGFAVRYLGGIPIWRVVLYGRVSGGGRLRPG